MWRVACRLGSMSESIRKGSKVRWNWGQGEGEGKVVERFTETVTRTIGGSKIKRKASQSEPAYLIEQEDGARALKSKSELSLG